MPQHDLDIANGAGNVVRADINAALVALGTHQRGPTAPPSPAAGWIWVDDNTPSATLWTVSQYDGAAWIVTGFMDTTNDRYWSAGAPIWGGTAGGTANALTVTTAPAPARFPGMLVSFLAAAANTGAATLNDNGLGAVAIRRPDNTALLPNDIIVGDVVQVVWDGSLWRMTSWPEAYVRGDRRVANNSAQIDIPLPAGFTKFRLEFDAVRPVNDAASLILRTSTDGGASFAAGGSDYNQTLEATRPASSNVFSAAAASSSIALSSGSDAANTAVSVNGSVEFFIGDGTRQPWFDGRSSGLEDGVAAITMHRVAGVRGALTAINAIRLLMTAGNISIGTFRLYGVR
jgi:hypothetical protein